MPSSDPRSTALKLLARREYSQFELKTKLKAKAFPLAEIETQLKLLKAEGLQSDARFTEAFINDRIRAGYGPRAICLALEEKGVAEALIDQFISVYSDAFWRSQLETLWQKRFGARKASSGTDLLAEKAKQYRFLSYRGFESHAIYALLKQVNYEEQ